MNGIVVSVVANEPSALRGVEALRELRPSSYITSYESIVLAKDEAGSVSHTESSEPGPLGAVSRTLRSKRWRPTRSSAEGRSNG